jgi:transporter family-2 protein
MGREAPYLYSVSAVAVGAVITLMSTVNSRFSGIVGNVVATLVIHVAGLVAVSAILLFKREESRPGRLPVYYYLGGFIGVGTVFSSIYSFTVLGAAFAVALALLGQTLCSVVIIDIIVDGVFDLRKLIGTLVLLLGLVINGLLRKRVEGMRPSA